MSDFLEKLALHLEKDQVLCIEGEATSDLYFVQSGKLLVCIRKGSEVIPLDYINMGEYLGELSFFDGMPRSADVIALEKSTLIKIPTQYLKEQFPSWLQNLSIFMALRIRKLDSIIQKKGLKKKNLKSITPLTIEDQRRLLEKIKNYHQSGT